MRKLACLTAVFIFSATACFGQNKLEKSKNELNSGAKPPLPTTPVSNTNTASKSSSLDSEDAGIFAEIFVTIIWGGIKFGLIGDYHHEDHLENDLAPRPYFDSRSGNYVAPIDSIPGRISRFDLEDHFIYSDNHLFGNHLKAKIRPFQYFYLQGDFHQLFELDKIDKTNDRLSLFHFNFCYDRVRLQRFNLGWNAGVSYVGNQVRRAGFSYGVSLEYFLRKQISFAASGNWSKINGLPVNTYEFSGRFHRKTYFLSLSYERLKIATPNYNFIGIGGGIYF